MKIVFMGTPDFATGCLEALHNAGHDIAAVFTRQDKPVGRKQILTPPPVKVLAEELGIPVYQPLNFKDEEAVSALKDINPDVIVVVAYGRILPQSVLDIPKYGCVNVHASMLPRHRGASPIQWCIVCGDNETGVTTMKMDAGLDTGDILLTRRTKIGDDETAGELFDRLSMLGSELIVETLEKLPELKSIPQGEEGVTFAPIITKEMAQMDFASKTAKQLCCEIRGFNPWPVSYFVLDNKRIKVYKAHEVEGFSGEAGTVCDAEKGFVIGCADDTAICLDVIKPEGKGEMSAMDYLRGKSIAKGAVIG